MTIFKAFQNFVRALCGQTPNGHDIAEMMNDAANKVGTITGTNGLDLNELNTDLTTLSGTVTDLEGDLTTLDSQAMKYEDDNDKSFLLNSSTTDSTKQFRITVLDNGTVTATEVVATPPTEEPANP